MRGGGEGNGAFVKFPTTEGGGLGPIQFRTELFEGLKDAKNSTTDSNRFIACALDGDPIPISRFVVGAIGDTHYAFNSANLSSTKTDDFKVEVGDIRNIAASGGVHILIEDPSSKTKYIEFAPTSASLASTKFRPAYMRYWIVVDGQKETRIGSSIDEVGANPCFILQNGVNDVKGVYAVSGLLAAWSLQERKNPYTNAVIAPNHVFVPARIFDLKESVLFHPPAANAKQAIIHGLFQTQPNFKPFQTLQSPTLNPPESLPSNASHTPNTETLIRPDGTTEITVRDGDGGYTTTIHYPDGTRESLRLMGPEPGRALPRPG
jgi:hypothetical protein